MQDSLAKILADAKRDRNEAAKRLLGLQSGRFAPVGMSQMEAEKIEETKIIELSAIIDRLGYREV